MTDYTELVKALRDTDFGDTCVYCEHSDMCKDDDCIILQAAAAIEALQTQLPKRGKIVRCGECRWGHLCVIGQHLGLDGFCSKGEREAQE